MAQHADFLFLVDHTSIKYIIGTQLCGSCWIQSCARQLISAHAFMQSIRQSLPKQHLPNDRFVVTHFLKPQHLFSIMVSISWQWAYLHHSGEHHQGRLKAVEYRFSLLSTRLSRSLNQHDRDLLSRLLFLPDLLRINFLNISKKKLGHLLVWRFYHIYK